MGCNVELFWVSGSLQDFPIFTTGVRFFSHACINKPLRRLTRNKAETSSVATDKEEICLKNAFLRLAEF